MIFLCPLTYSLYRRIEVKELLPENTVSIQALFDKIIGPFKLNNLYLIWKIERLKVAFS